MKLVEIRNISRILTAGDTTMKLIAIPFLMLTAFAAAAENPNFVVEVKGKGQPMILIPGYASSGDTWAETVAHYKDTYECHVLTLAGFAGVPASNARPFLPAVVEDLAAYIKKLKLNKPVMVGHSLGGVVTLALAAKYPDQVGPLVIVDSLPFLAAVINPEATVDSVKPMVEGMRKSFASQTAGQREEMAEMSIRPLVTAEADYKRIRAWSSKSDPTALTEAMADMFAMDLRADLAKIKSRAIVLGTWIAYKQYASREAVEANFRLQYAKLKGMKLVMFELARHFIMFDDPAGFYQAVDEFLLTK